MGAIIQVKVPAKNVFGEIHHEPAMDGKGLGYNSLHMEEQQSAFTKNLFPFLLMMLIGWGGLVVLMTFTLPFVWARWAFYFLLTLALTATALPVTHFLNIRFPSDPPAGTDIILRQALWFGIYGAALVWLWKFLTIQMAFGLAGGFILIEWLIRLRERSRFQPKAVKEFSAIEDSPDKS